ncbi:MAG TPA: MFS transporter [Bryobacteraceae bacterium]|nr:MFS transporter [Bryobacteraceae bacterium]
MTPPAASPGRAARPTLRYPWCVVLVLTAIYMLSFVDRQILAFLVGPIERDFGVNDTRMGLLQGLAFALFYTFMGLPLGRMVDTSNRRRLVSICVLIWSIFTAGCAATKSFLTLFLARIGVGVGEAGLGPAAYSLISDYFPKEKMGAAISVYYMGLFFGSAVASLVGGITLDALARTPLLTIPVLGTIASWRIIFLIVGLPGLLFALLAYAIREPVRLNLLLAADGRPAKATFRETFAQIRLRWKSMAGISVGMACQALTTYAVTAWAPTYFVRAHGWNLAQTGKVLALVLIVFACSGMYVGGIVSDRWQKRGIADAPLRTGVISALGMIVFLAPSLVLPQIDWTLAFFVTGVFFMAFAMGSMVAALQVIFPNQARGQVGALFLFVLNLGGLTLGPLLPGYFNDHLFHDPRMIGPSLALTLEIASVLMLILLAATRKPYREDFTREYTRATAA